MSHTTQSGMQFAAMTMSQSASTINHTVAHSNPNSSMYQGSTNRYTASAQSYIIADFNTPATLGGSNSSYTFARTADLGGNTFLLVGLPGIANCIHLTDVSGNDGVCEIVHPDILKHYRAAMGISQGLVIAEDDMSFQFVAQDDGNNFKHALEGQPYWTPNVGYHAQTSVVLNCGSAVVDTQRGERMAAWSEINQQPGKRLGAMVGGSDLGSIRLNKHLEFKRRSMRFQLLCIPILFSFAHSTASYLPLPALQFHEISLTFNFRSASQLICNGSNLNGNNMAGAKSEVVAATNGKAPEEYATPFDNNSDLDASGNEVYTIYRYGEDSSESRNTKKGAMVALVNDASWNLTEADLSNNTYQVTDALCKVQCGGRFIFLQGEERAAMIQGGYDIPMLVTQLATNTGQGSDATLKVDMAQLTNSIEALYVLNRSSNACGANHYNAGRTFDPLVEEYTSMGNLSVQINGNTAYDDCAPEFFNKMCAYINGHCVPTGDSHVYFVPFSLQTNSTDDSVEQTGSASAASRWSSANVTLKLNKTLTTDTAFSKADSDKDQKVYVLADTYNSFHVGGGVGGSVFSNTSVSTTD